MLKISNREVQETQPFNVLGVDPGGTSGWVHAYTEVTNPELSDIKLMTGEFGPGPHHQEIYEFIRQLQPKEIVSEPFHFRQHIDNPRHKVELISVEYIGVIKLACAQLGLSYYDRFLPGEAKRYVPNRKLELLGWLQTPITPMRHRNDALRQLVKYLIVKKRVRHPITTAWRENDATGSE